MKIKYLLIFCFIFSAVCNSLQAIPNFSFAKGHTIEFENSISPILPKKDKPKRKTKSTQYRPNSKSSSFTFFLTLLAIVCGVGSLAGGIYFMGWLISSTTNLGTVNNVNLIIGIALFLGALFFFSFFAIVIGIEFIGKKFKFWTAIFFFIAINAIIFAMLFFIYGLLAQIWFFLAIALGLAIFGILGVFFTNRALYSISQNIDYSITE